MKALSEAVVSAEDLTRAASQVRARRKHFHKGTRGAPKTTLIYSRNGALVIYTPFVRTEIPMSGEWNVCISVDAATLTLLSQRLPQFEQVTLTHLPDKLAINGGQFMLPSKLEELPD